MDINDNLFNDTDSLFADEDINTSDMQYAESALESEVSDSGECWKVLVVDDEKDIHLMTSLALESLNFKDKKIQFLNAYSAQQAKEILSKEENIALILLDVVMETTDAGLKLVEHIRQTMNMQNLRIVLRTGQPGYAPEMEVIKSFDINDYQNKAEVTQNKLITATISSLRSYQLLQMLEDYSQSLEQMVEQRTVEVMNQKTQIEDQHQEIKSSITYAKRIQTAILPTEEYIKKVAPKSFVLFKPKDIVSGDFYWFEIVPNKQTSKDEVFAAVVDCTGHGVPGAMVSLIGYNGLQRCLNALNLREPNQILDALSAIVVESFSRSNSDMKDGMDISLIRVADDKLTFAGANNSIYITRKSELIELKADRQPIGKYAYRKPFSLQSFDLQVNDSVYLFTDGFADQFGGPKNKKMKYSTFKEILLAQKGVEMSEQANQIFNHFETWRGSQEQIDDVCIMGLQY
ncbi:MAG: SpoIIE family protein phosphatase [Salibacteraceae bacterium]|nr:SpoIIE family protein phosphatase [Salibacteraceae bacterium]